MAFGETENVLSVRVEREDLADSRWFTGCGIYRKVSIETSEPVGFAHHGVFFSVDSVADGCANITVQSEVENHTGEDAETTLCHRLLTQDGEEAAVLEKAVTVAAGEKPWSP